MQGDETTQKDQSIQGKCANDSEWAAPTFVVPKKTGNVCILTDFHELNKAGHEEIETISTTKNIRPSTKTPRRV